MCGISGFFLGKDNKIPEYDLNGRLKKCLLLLIIEGQIIITPG